MSSDSGTSWQAWFPYRGIRLCGMKLTCSPSTTQTKSPSQTTSVVTQSGTATPSITPSPTGFPLQPVIDNTGIISNGLSVSNMTLISVLSWQAISFFLPEVDPSCGPGKYSLEALAVPLVLCCDATTQRSITLSVTLVLKRLI